MVPSVSVIYPNAEAQRVVVGRTAQGGDPVAGVRGARAEGHGVFLHGARHC